ncbi:HutD family protein [Dyella tabacisoli]|uniref:HutD family protein n=1 Tax=Dyella tabacisoli TaxID=2282381 RepID=A0A369UIB2_9GAMM|nr:HutD family protein [Dyella tabacisoli]RDD80237.1 HutD family protein [Dyella tabacisoli]
MSARIIRADACTPVPWKNGQGLTREIARHPSAADGEHFLWRVSVAEVNSAAPFSAFPGIDRHIALLDGAGFTMTLDDRHQHALCTPFKPFAFPGEAQVTVTLANGPTRDFNLMTRRDHGRGEITAWATPGDYRVEKGIVLIYCARGSFDTHDGALHTGDAWLFPPAATIVLPDGAAALAVWIEGATA